MKTARLYGTIGLVAVVLLGILFIPLPYHVVCSVKVEPRDAQTVYVEVSGSLQESFVEPGVQIEKGQRLAQLEDFRTDYDVVDLEGRRDVYAVRYKNLVNYLRHSSEEAVLDEAVLKSTLDGIERQLGKQTDKIGKLTLVAPTDGVVMPPPPQPPRNAEGVLPTWSGSPLNKRNLGARLEQGQPFCRIGDPAKLEAILVIDQSKIEFVQEGQAVEIMLDQFPDRTLKTSIHKISSRELRDNPNQLSEKAGGELETRTDAQGRERLASTSYQANADLLPTDAEQLRIGLKGQARIRVANRTLGSRIWRLATETFNFRL